MRGRLVGQGVGVFERRSWGSLDDDHQIPLVFLGKEAGGHTLVHPDRRRQSGDKQQQQQVTDAQRQVNGAAVGPAHPGDCGVGAVNEGCECAGDEADVEEVQLARALFVTAEEKGRKGRRQRQRVKCRNGDRERNGQRELAVENAGGSGEERHRHEHRDQHERRGDHGAGDLAHGARSGRVRVGVLHVNMSLHVLDDHDGIVDHQARGQRNAEQRERVDGESEQLDERECPDQRDRDGDRGNNGGAPIEQKQER